MQTTNYKKNTQGRKKAAAIGFGTGAILGATAALVANKKLNQANQSGVNYSSLEMYDLELKNNLLEKDIKKSIDDIKELKKTIKEQQEANKKLHTQIVECNKGYIDLSEKNKKEKDSNVKLSTHINECNKEVVRLRGINSKRPELRREAILRNTLSKLIQK